MYVSSIVDLMWVGGSEGYNAVSNSSRPGSSGLMGQGVDLQERPDVNRTANKESLVLQCIGATIQQSQISRRMWLSMGVVQYAREGTRRMTQCT